LLYRNDTITQSQEKNKTKLDHEKAIIVLKIFVGLFATSGINKPKDAMTKEACEVEAIGQ
jgi:hypothetical protein